jgi:hypothetical protein
MKTVNYKVIDYYWFDNIGIVKTEDLENKQERFFIGTTQLAFKVDENSFVERPKLSEEVEILAIINKGVPVNRDKLLKFLEAH